MVSQLLKLTPSASTKRRKDACGREGREEAGIVGSGEKVDDGEKWAIGKKDSLTGQPIAAAWGNDEQHHNASQAVVGCFAQ
jgi:hypothetical protein